MSIVKRLEAALASVCDELHEDAVRAASDLRPETDLRAVEGLLWRA